MFHESGHAVNATMKSDYISNSKEFDDAVLNIWNKLDKTDGVGAVLNTLPNFDRVKDEVFADLWGHLHATPKWDNEYSNTMRQIFAPVFEQMKPWSTK